jgi:hypothetical protein
VKDLPVAARLFVGAVLAAGAVTLALFLPHGFENPVLFAFLLTCSSLTSALKVSLPLASSGSTMSVSYAVDFAALLLLGADQTMLVAAASAWSQCTFRTQSRSAPYRTLFSMASLVLTVRPPGGAMPCSAAPRRCRSRCSRSPSRWLGRPRPTSSSTRC